MKPNKNILFLVIFILFEQSIFCQDSLTNKKYNFYIHAGINNSVPLKNNYNIINLDNTGNIEDDFIVFPQFKLGGCLTSFGYQHLVFNFNKYKISSGLEINFNIYNSSIVKVGIWKEEEYDFNGVINTISHFYNTSLNIVLSQSYILNKTTELNVYMSGGTYTYVINNNKITEKDITCSDEIKYNINNYFSNTLYFVSSSFKIEICKIMKTKKYGVFIGSQFLGTNSYSVVPNIRHSENVWNPVQEFAHNYFILNYGLTYKF